jgi:GR25 family glycosyltransferase involved in LPS biosynthesis
MALAPVVLFVYNRPEHTKQTVVSLQKNKIAAQSELFIYSDGSKNRDDKKAVDEVRNYLRTIKGFGKIKIIERKKNKGLAKSIISGTNEIINKYGKVIVLEDDLLLSNNFLSYMNDCLKFYQNDKRIFSISGYSAASQIPLNYDKDIFLFYRINSWGWATWADRWNNVDWEVGDFDTFIRNKKERRNFDRGGEDSTIMLLKQMQGKINSWAIRFNYACYKNNGLNIYPVRSKVFNAGTDGSGTHISKTTKYKTELNENDYVLSKDIHINREIIDSYKKLLFTPSIFRKVINYLKLRRALFSKKK